MKACTNSSRTPSVTRKVSCTLKRRIKVISAILVLFIQSIFTGATVWLFGVENFKERDKNITGKTLFPSEALLQSYFMATDSHGASPANLKLIVRHIIMNVATLSIIRQVTEKSTCTGLKSLDFGGKNIPQTWCWVFFAILGSPNGASTARMMLGHSSEIGFRKTD